MHLTFALPPKLPVIKGDRDKVMLVLHNLVGNALKYTPAGGGITVEVRADGAQLSVAVKDTGIGIRPEDLIVECLGKVSMALATRSLEVRSMLRKSVEQRHLESGDVELF